MLCYRTYLLLILISNCTDQTVDMPILWSACVFRRVSLDVVQSIIMWVHYKLGPLCVYLFIMFAVF